MQTKVTDPNLRKKVLTIIKVESGSGHDIGQVANQLGVAWATARAILLEMVLAGQIAGAKTSRGWIFFPPGQLKEIGIPA